MFAFWTGLFVSLSIVSCQLSVVRFLFPTFHSKQGATTIPNQAYIGIIPTAYVHGSKAHSPFLFQPNNLKSLQILVSGHSRPSPNGYRDIIWDGNGSNYVLPYFTLFDRQNLLLLPLHLTSASTLLHFFLLSRDMKHNEGTSIDLDEYRTSFCLYRFTLGTLTINSQVK